MDLAELGKRIQKVREQVLQLKQTELAKDLGTVQTLISRLERGIGGNIHLLMDIVNYLERKGYPAHILFAKDFGVELFKKNDNNTNGNFNPISSQMSELKYFLQKGFERAITLETLIGDEKTKKTTTYPKSDLKKIQKKKNQ